MSDEKLIGEKGWTLGAELGSGHFAKVRLVVRNSDGQRAACKIIKKPKDKKKRSLIGQEEEMMKSLEHPYVVKFYDSFETDDKLYLILEIMEGGELFDRIVDKGHFSEKDAQTVTAKLILALEYMHSKGIAHRDLKPENMLMTSKDATAECKITDFGLGKFFDAQSSMMKTPCGTPGYIAPEVLLMRGYDQACDVWSLGVIVYILLCGFPPFYADNDAQLFERIKKGQYEFLKPYWDPVSEEAKAFIRKMLVVDPKKRATCADLLQDQWLAGCISDAKLAVEMAAPSDAPQLHTAQSIGEASESLKKLKKTFLSAYMIVSLSEAPDNLDDKLGKMDIATDR